MKGRHIDFARHVEFIRKVDSALRLAIAELIQEHGRTGDPLVVSKDGKVTFISPDEALLVREREEPYTTGEDDLGD